MLERLREKILCIAVIDRSGKKSRIGMAQLYILGELGLQIRVTRLVGILIQEKEKGVQVLVCRTIDATAIVQRELILFTGCIADIGGGEQAEIATGKARIPVELGAIAQLVTGVVGVLQPQTGLNTPLLVLLVKVEIAGVDILTIEEVIGLRGVYLAGAMNDIIIVGRVVRIDIARFQTGLDFYVLTDGMCIVRLERIDIDPGGQIAGENGLAAVVAVGIGSDIIEILVAAGRIMNIVQVCRQLPSRRIILMAVVQVDRTILPGIVGCAGGIDHRVDIAMRVFQKYVAGAVVILLVLKTADHESQSSFIGISFFVTLTALSSVCGSTLLTISKDGMIRS